MWVCVCVCVCVCGCGCGCGCGCVCVRERRGGERVSEGGPRERGGGGGGGGPERERERGRERERLCEMRVSETQFADDAALYTTSQDSFESTTVGFVKVVSEWGLTVSIKKTKGMVAGQILD